MVNTAVPPPTTLSKADKLQAISSITTFVPVKPTWAFHLQEPLEMVRGRPIVKIFLTCNDILVGRLVKANPKTSLTAWSFLERIFLDNKRTKTKALRGELQVLDMGDMTVDSYFAKIESITTLLSDLGSPMHDRRPYHASHP
ncbi:hypothetical protein Tco_1150530 [Tanacetum coccineum]